MSTEPASERFISNPKVLSRFVALPATATSILAFSLWGRGVNLVGALFALALPLGALALIYVLLRDGGFRSSEGLVSGPQNARRYWATIGILGLVYLVATVALAALLLRSTP
jgi:hypothetical protein